MNCLYCESCGKYICSVDGWKPQYEGKVYCGDCGTEIKAKGHLIKIADSE